MVYFFKLFFINKVDKMLEGLSDKHLYDEDEEEDIALRYQHISTDDHMDCD